MKRSYFPFFCFVILVFVFLCLPGLLHAQPGDPGGGAPDPGCGPDYDCPIDSGLITLIAIGIVYGVKKIRDQKKAESFS